MARPRPTMVCLTRTTARGTGMEVGARVGETVLTVGAGVGGTK